VEAFGATSAPCPRYSQGPLRNTCDLGGAGIIHGNYSAAPAEMIGTCVHDIEPGHSAQCAGYVTVPGSPMPNRRGPNRQNLVIHARIRHFIFTIPGQAVIVCKKQLSGEWARGWLVGYFGGGVDIIRVVPITYLRITKITVFATNSGTNGPE